VDDRWREFMRFEIAYNRDLYAQAMLGIKLLNADGRLAVAAAGELYRGILDDIEAHDYERVCPSRIEFRLLPGCYVSALGYRGRICRLRPPSLATPTGGAARV
jgi:hypothetical protein